MKIVNRHERLIASSPARIGELVRDFDRIWPTEIAPAPLAVSDCLFDAGPMLWQEVDRPGASRAFVGPDRGAARRALVRARTSGRRDACQPHRRGRDAR
jgi:hypothetical protein